MARNPEAKFSMLNVSLKNGENYGCSTISGVVIPGGDPAISFISSGYEKTVPIAEVKEITVSVDCWCPRCE